MTVTRSEPGRGEIEDLLPWYANGRLSLAERKRVEAALLADPELDRRLELVREEMAETIAANETLVPKASPVLDRLMAAIDAEPRPTRPLALVRESLFDRFAGFLADLAPRRLAGMAAAVVVVMVVQTGAVSWLATGRPQSGFETASQGAATTSSPTLLVAFSPDAKIDRISELLRLAGAEVAEGPKANGFYRLRPVNGRDATTVAETLKGEAAIVTFVQVTW